jgi:hypothetical protein
MTHDKTTRSAKTKMTRQDFMNYFRSENGWADLTADDRYEVFMDILHGDGDLTADILDDLIRNYGARHRLEVKDREHAPLYILTMEDAEAVLEELGHRPTKDQLDEMEYRIRKGVEWGLGECWRDVMQVACEEAWREMHEEAAASHDAEGRG